MVAEEEWNNQEVTLLIFSVLGVCWRSYLHISINKIYCMCSFLQANVSSTLIGCQVFQIIT